VRNLPRRCQ